MPGKSDGQILIETKLDVSGIDKAMEKLAGTIKKGSEQGKNQFDKLDDSVDKTADNAGQLDSAFNFDTSELERAVRDLDNLNARIEVQQRALEELRAKYARTVNVQGADSSEAMKLQKQILATENSINKMSDASDKAAAKIRKMESGMEGAVGGVKKLGSSSNTASDGLEKAGDEAENAGDKAAKSKKGFDTMQFAIADLIARAIERMISSLINLAGQMQEFNLDMSRLAQNANDAGVSMDVVDAAMRDLNFITGETDSNIEALSNLMEAGFDDNNLQRAVDELSGAVIKFPDTLKIENLAESLQETLATGEATGQFEEMLGRVGVSVDDFEKGLQRAIKAGNEQEYVLDVLSKTGLADVAKAYEEANQQQKDYADAQYDLKQAQAEIAEKMLPVITEAIRAITDILNDHEKEITTMIYVVGEIAKVLLDVISLLSSIPAEAYVVIAVVAAFFTILTKLTSTVSSVTAGIGGFTAAMSPANMTISQTIVLVTALVGAMALLVFLLIALKEGANGAKRAMESFNNVKVPEVKQPQRGQKGYASGTSNAMRGWRLVGENGPELMRFNGGERVLNAQQTHSYLTQNANHAQNIGTLVINPDARQWAQVMDLLAQAKSAQQQRRAR